MNIKLGIVLLIFTAGLKGMDGQRCNIVIVENFKFHLTDLLNAHHAPRLERPIRVICKDGSLEENLINITEAVKSCDKGHGFGVLMQGDYFKNSPKHTLFFHGEKTSSNLLLKKFDFKFPDLSESMLGEKSKPHLIVYNVHDHDGISADTHVKNILDENKKQVHFMLFIDKSEKSKAVVDKLASEKATDLKYKNLFCKEQVESERISVPETISSEAIRNQSYITKENLKNFINGLLSRTTLTIGSCAAFIMFLLHYKIIEIKINAF